MYGYFPEPAKSVVIVASKYVEIAKSTIQKVGVKSLLDIAFLEVRLVKGNTVCNLSSG